MKKIAGLLLSAALFAQCNQANKPSEGNGSVSVTANPSQTPNNPNLQLTQKGTPTSLKGSIKGAAANSKVFLDRKTADASETIGSVQTAADGSFSLSVGITEAGIYRLRVGLAAAYFVLDGGENLDIQASVDAENVLSFAVTGSDLAAELPALTVSKSLSEKEIANFLSKTPSANPFVNYYLLEKLPLDKYLGLAEKVFAELEKKSPNGANTLSLGAKISSLKVSLNAGGGEVAIGKTPPDIQLKNPDGKVIALSALKGKVVLLDFWASWCGPCRRENPNVVRIYEQYKNKGFTVYSVSLDGLDDQRLMAMQGNPDAINQQLEGQRQRWIGAIQQDKLSWENHVSDLRGWSCSAAVTYGVNSIPRTYLLNRSGQIVAMDLRGAALEEAVKKYIN